MQHFATKSLLSIAVGTAAVLMFAATSQARWTAMDTLAVDVPGALESHLVDLVLTVDGYDQVKDDDLVDNYLSVYLEDPNATDQASDALREAGPMVRLERADGTELVPFTEGGANIDDIFAGCTDSCEVLVRAEIVTEFDVTAHFELAIVGPTNVAPEGVSVSIEERIADQ